MLMRRDGATLVETGQTVKVRHIGEAAVAAGTIVTPEPCGTLGLCFVREVQVVRAGLTAQRFLKLVGPIDPVTTGPTADYTTEWKFGAWIGRKLPIGSDPIPGTAKSGYYIDHDLSATQTTINGTPRWLKPMRPLRFQVHGFGGQFIEPVYRAQRPDLTGETVTWLNDVIQMASGERDTIGVSHHLSPIVFSSVKTSMGGVCSTKVFQYISTPEQLAPEFGMAIYLSYVVIMFARLWIDGVDVTGIVAQTPVTNIDRPPFPLTGYDTTPFTFPIDPAELIGKTCYLDLWPRYDIRGTRQATSVTRQVGWIDAANNGHVLSFNSTDYASTPNANDSRWDFAFDADGPGGLTTLTTAYVDNAANGWTRLPETDGQSFSKFPALTTTGQKAYRLRFRYVRGDRASIEYTIYTSVSKAGLGGTYLAWDPVQYFYSPEDTGDYSGVLLRSGYTVRAGKWTPGTATVFAVTGGRPASINPSLTEFQYDAQSGIAMIYEGIPLEITVTEAA
jgi:hypothetical protein